MSFSSQAHVVNHQLVLPVIIHCTLQHLHLQEFGILELARTGMVALERGQYTLDEDTKEKGEFDYGKNLL